MKKIALTTLFASSLLLFTGCGESTTPAPSAELLEKIEAFASANKKLDQRIADLEKTNRMLQGEVNVLKESANSPAAPASIDGDALTQKVSEIVNNELANLIAAKFDEQAGGQGITQQLLASSWQQQMTAFEEKKAADEEIRREERRKADEERRAEQQAERLVKMAEDLGINDTQAEQLQVAMDTMREQARDMFTKMREEGSGFNRDTIRDEMAKLREMHLQVTSQFLTPDQQTAYSEMSDRGGFGGGPGGSWGGRGGGGR